MRFLPTSRLRFALRHRRSPPTLLRNEDGAAALEFAIVALPFLLFVLGLLGIGLYLLAGNSLQYGAEAAARKVRTGEAEKGAMTVGQFRQLVCQEAGAFIDCNKLSVIVQHAANWSGISPQACVDGNNSMVGSTGSEGEQLTKYSGTASEVVLITLCYRWDLAEQFPFLKLGSGSGGSGPAVIQASTAFKSEPYNL